MHQNPPQQHAKTPRGRRPPASGAALDLQLARGPGNERLYQQIRGAISGSILAGEMSGRRLPPTREMASALGVNRATVARAYQELEADGLVESEGARGTVVVSGASSEPALSRTNGTAAPTWVSALPPFAESGLSADPTLIRDISFHSRRPDFISFAIAAPGPELIPAQRMERALGDALKRWGPSALGYGPVDGLDALRETLARTVAMPLLAPGDALMVVSGATQGLSLAARTLIEPGDEVAVEAPTYFGMLQTFALAGARLVGIPIDRNGIRVDHLEAVLSQRRVRLIVVQPRFQNPTGAVMSAERRAQLLLLARRHAIPVLEDDLYGDLDLDGGAPAPLKREDRSGSVVYLSSFSKSISPGLRIGWMVAQAPVVNRLVVAKQFSDLASSALAQLVVADLLESGDYASHLRSVVGEYRARRAALVDAIKVLDGRLEPTFVPAGGSNVWCRLAPGIDSRMLAAAGIRRKVAVLPGHAFYPPGQLRGEGGHDRVRLSFTGVPAERMAEGIDRLAKAIDSLPAAQVGAPEGAGILV
jgi:DNA-binding transcriptional MocR family regulator